MKFLINIINHFMIKKNLKPNPLGRWSIDCNNETNQKIDLSNEDHCGPCGQYIINKKALLTSKKI